MNKGAPTYPPLPQVPQNETKNVTIVTWRSEAFYDEHSFKKNIEIGLELVHFSCVVLRSNFIILPHTAWQSKLLSMYGNYYIQNCSPCHIYLTSCRMIFFSFSRSKYMVVNEITKKIVFSYWLVNIFYISW